MSEVDPFLNQVRQGADYLRGLRTPLRRGMAVAGGFALLAGSLSACGDSPHARAEGAQTETGVSAEASGPAGTGSPESSDQALAPTESPSADAGATLDPSTSTEATPFSEIATTSQENSSSLDKKIKQATVGFVISCSDGGEPDVNIKNYQTPDLGKFPMAISVTCGTPESAKARIITGEEQILPEDDQLLLLFDGTQGASGVSESNLSEHARSSDGTTVAFWVDGFSVNSQASSCLAVGLSGSINNGGPVISSILIDESNKATGTVGTTCGIYQPGQQIQ